MQMIQGYLRNDGMHRRQCCIDPSAELARPDLNYREYIKLFHFVCSYLQPASGCTGDAVITVASL